MSTERHPAFRLEQEFPPDSDCKLETQGNSITVTLFYTGDRDTGFTIHQRNPETEDYGILEVQVEVGSETLFGGLEIILQDRDGELLQLERSGSPASMNVKLPSGGLEARDGVGDWTKVVTLSKKD